MIGCKFSAEPHPFNNVIKAVGLSVFERFTERARQVVVLAQQEARNNKCAYIGTEHILMGILREEEGLAARVLASLDVEVGKAAKLVAATAQGEPREETGQIPMTPRAKKVLELALREALGLGHNYIGTEHVLLGLLREGENKAVAILQDNFQLDPEQIRNEVIRMLSGPSAPILHQKTTRRISEVTSERIPIARSDELRLLMEESVTLGRQYPDRPTKAIVSAVLALHG
jgi:ATP-dependent Clp protease ATP-binding subunit ClpC